MNKLQALNTWMTPKMPLLILGALALGLLFPDQIGLLCPAVSALMMFQTFANSLGSSVDLASARAILSNLQCHGDSKSAGAHAQHLPRYAPRRDIRE